MERIGVRELRQHASRYLELVKAGESVEVTERGKLVALIVPPRASRREQLIASGGLIPSKRRLGHRKPLDPVPGFSASDELQRMRSEDR